MISSLGFFLHYEWWNRSQEKEIILWSVVFTFLLLTCYLGKNIFKIWLYWFMSWRKKLPAIILLARWMSPRGVFDARKRDIVILRKVVAWGHCGEGDLSDNNNYSSRCKRGRKTFFICFFRNPPYCLFGRATTFKEDKDNNGDFFLYFIPLIRFI